jgi:hypothetical protein
MDLEKAFKLVEEYESSVPEAHRIVDYLKENIKKVVTSGKFFNVSFQKSDKNGIIIIKYANACPDTGHKEALDSSTNIMISIEGFGSDGNLVEPKAQSHTFHWVNKNVSVKRLPSFVGKPLSIAQAIVRWFKNNCEELTKIGDAVKPTIKEDAVGGGGTASIPAGGFSNDGNVQTAGPSSAGSADNFKGIGVKKSLLGKKKRKKDVTEDGESGQYGSAQIKSYGQISGTGIDLGHKGSVSSIKL